MMPTNTNAKTDRTGTIITTHATDANVVMQAAIDALTAGSTWQTTNNGEWISWLQTSLQNMYFRIAS